MNRWIRSGLVPLCAVVLGVACGSKEGGDSSAKASTSGSAAPKASGSAAAAAPSPSGSAVAAAAPVSDDDLIKAASENKGDSSGVLSVDMSGVDDAKAPPLGGSAPPAAPAAGKLEWLPAGAVQIPNPGWKLTDIKDVGAVLSPPDKQKVFAFFTQYDKPENALKFVDQFVKGAQLTDLKWAKPKPYLIGSDKIPALLGFGHGKNKEGKPVTMFYELLKTGAPKNLMAIGGGDDDADKNDVKMVLNIVTGIKKAAAK